ncbi:PTS glucose transporter subunit IIA [Lacrimispora sp.]|uniref:PTS sugar transporter subunit IIA n=1 Tax=Lacrimispora sp. TaxID=2719234 RepID=UPI00345F1CD9
MGLLNNLFLKKKEAEKADPVVKEDVTIFSPLKGEVLPLSEVKDEAFACGALGNGIAVEPVDGKVVSPVNGTVVSIFPTNHALGITSEDGAEILIHIGLDTVKLGGKYFTAYVEQGQSVKKGDTLITFELDRLREEGYVTQVPVLIINTPAYSCIEPLTEGSVDYGDVLLKLKY